MELQLSLQQKRVLELESRKKIFDVIKKFQGCHLRDLQRKSEFSFGTLQHHLHYLAKHGLLRVEKEGNNNRYFTQKFSIEQRVLLSLLRQQSVRRILLLLTIKENPSHKEIVDFVKLSPATVTWHLKKLTAKNIIKAHQIGREKEYTLQIEKDKVIYLLLDHQKTFTDKILDNVAEMWDF